MNKKKYIVILVFLLLISGLVFVWRDKMFKTNEEKKLDLKKQSDEQYQKDVKILDETIADAKLTDKDLDGISDEEEKKMGTNIYKSDSDADGLLDSDEVKYYKSDPIKSDTDGDKFKDGEEVRRGYSPLGPGKL